MCTHDSICYSILLHSVRHHSQSWCNTGCVAQQCQAHGGSGILQMILKKHVATHVLIWDGLSPGAFGGFLSNEATQHFNKHFSVRHSPFRACERAYSRVNTVMHKAHFPEHPAYDEFQTPAPMQATWRRRSSLGACNGAVLLANGACRISLTLPDGPTSSLATWCAACAQLPQGSCHTPFRRLPHCGAFLASLSKAAKCALRSSCVRCLGSAQPDVIPKRLSPSCALCSHAPFSHADTACVTEVESCLKVPWTQDGLANAWRTPTLRRPAICERPRGINKAFIEDYENHPCNFLDKGW